MSRKAVCISCFHHYDNRMRFVEGYLKKQGYACTYITSNFDHVHKAPFLCDLPQSIQIPTRPYYKNLSFDRIFSHICFARDAMNQVRKIKPDLLYVMVPPNSLCREAAQYKKENPNVKLVFDVYDLWPETFPSSRAKKLLSIPFGVWGWLRDSSLKAADVIFTECDLFRQVLGNRLAGIQTDVLYLCRAEITAKEDRPLLESEEVHLCYLGSINNIIDIPAIAALIGKIQARRPVVLHIIGDGESREHLISAVRNTGAQVEFYGKIFDPEKRQQIFDKCFFGINVMKESVCVGLTMKSLDYFAGGLPIINTIQGDTAELVRDKNAGVNLNRGDPDKTAEVISKLTAADLVQMRQNTLGMFRDLFLEESFAATLHRSLDNL